MVWMRRFISPGFSSSSESSILTVEKRLFVGVILTVLTCNLRTVMPWPAEHPGLVSYYAWVSKVQGMMLLEIREVSLQQLCPTVLMFVRMFRTQSPYTSVMSSLNSANARAASYSLSSCHHQDPSSLQHPDDFKRCCPKGLRRIPTGFLSLHMNIRTAACRDQNRIAKTHTPYPRGWWHLPHPKTSRKSRFIPFSNRGMLSHLLTSSVRVGPFLGTRVLSPQLLCPTHRRWLPTFRLLVWPNFRLSPNALRAISLPFLTGDVRTKISVRTGEVELGGSCSTVVIDGKSSPPYPGDEIFPPLESE